MSVVSVMDSPLLAPADPPLFMCHLTAQSAHVFATRNRSKPQALCAGSAPRDPQIPVWAGSWLWRHGALVEGEDNRMDSRYRRRRWTCLGATDGKPWRCANPSILLQTGVDSTACKRLPRLPRPAGKYPAEDLDCNRRFPTYSRRMPRLPLHTRFRDRVGRDSAR